MPNLTFSAGLQLPDIQPADFQLAYNIYPEEVLEETGNPERAMAIYGSVANLLREYIKTLREDNAEENAIYNVVLAGSKLNCNCASQQHILDLLERMSTEDCDFSTITEDHISSLRAEKDRIKELLTIVHDDAIDMVHISNDTGDLVAYHAEKRSAPENLIKVALSNYTKYLTALSQAEEEDNGFFKTAKQKLAGEIDARQDLMRPDKHIDGDVYDSAVAKNFSDVTYDLHGAVLEDQGKDNRLAVDVYRDTETKNTPASMDNWKKISTKFAVNPVEQVASNLFNKRVE